MELGGAESTEREIESIDSLENLYIEGSFKLILYSYRYI